MILSAQFLGSLFEPPFADTLVHVGVAAASFITALALGGVVYLLALLLGPGLRL